MPAGLPVAIALLAEAAGAAPADPAPTSVASAPPTYGPVKPAPPKPPVKTADDGCASAVAKADTREIVVCAQRPQGYRLNPDVMEAKREMRSGGRPRPPENFKINNCATVGPMGCRGGAGIDLVNAATLLGTMAARLAKGQEIGSMFVTDPHPTEYQLYVEAKHRREAKEAEAAAAAKAKAVQAAKAANQPEAVKTEPGSPPPGP